MVQCLGLGTFTAMGPGSIPGQELRSCKPRGVAKKKKKKNERVKLPEENIGENLYDLLLGTGKHNL